MTGRSCNLSDPLGVKVKPEMKGKKKEIKEGEVLRTQLLAKLQALCQQGKQF